MGRSYKEPNELELETTVNVLYGENIFSIYTNKPQLQKQLLKILGEPTKEDKKGKYTISSSWEVSLDEKSKISKILLRANIFEI